MAQIRALVIGVDAAFNRNGGGFGCDRDARRFTALLTDTLGFDPTELRLLVNRQATRRDVIASLHWLLSDVQDGDVRVLYFSGLGFRLPQDGLLREVLVLHDGSYLFDNEINFLTRQAPPHTVTVVLDTCFEGGLDQRFGAPELGAVKAWQPDFGKVDLLDYRERFARVSYFKPFGCRPIQCSRTDMLEMQVGTPILKPSAQSRMNALLVKACQHHEVAVIGRTCSSRLSAFTFALCRYLESRGGFVSSSEALDGAASKLAAMGVGQTPQHIHPPEWGAPEHCSFIAQAPVEAPVEPQEAIPGRDIRRPSHADARRLDPFLRLLPPSVGRFAAREDPMAAARKREVSDESE